MDRRQYLLSVASVAGVGIAGCLGDDSGREGLSVEGTAPTLSPGTDAVISATAYNADRFRFSPPEIAHLPGSDAHVSPSSDEQADSFPPGWVWDEAKSTIDAELTVGVPSDVNVGEYTYGVTVANGSKRVHADFTIEVES